MPLKQTLKESHRPPLCAVSPVLWSLLPLMAGILSARAWGASGLCLAGASAIALLHFSHLPRRHLFAFSCILGSSLSFLQMKAPHPDWRELPQREVTFRLQIEELFHARKEGRIAGIGKVLQSDIPHDTITGHRAAFYLEWEEPPCAGEEILGTAILTYLPKVDSPDDYQTYLMNRDIFLTLNRGRAIQRLQEAPPMEAIRRRLYTASQRALTHGASGSDSPGQVLASMLLGNRSLLSDKRVELYRRTGTYHLFAVSGLHVGSVAACLYGLCSLIRLPLRWRVVPALAFTWYYVWLTGASPSAVRAGIMISCVSASRYLFRQPHLFPALAFSAWLVLLLDPMQLFNLGFQLSYGVVAAIVLVGLPMTEEARRRIGPGHFHRPPMPRWKHYLNRLGWATFDLGCVSVSASLASTPLIIQHFNLFTPGGILLGIILNPLASLSIMAGCLIVLGGPLFPALFGWLAVATWPIIRLMEHLLATCLAIPGTSMDARFPIPWAGTIVLILLLTVAWLLQYLRQRGRKLSPLTHAIPAMVVLAGLALAEVGT